MGHIVYSARLPLDTQPEAYFKVMHPDDGHNWQLRLQVRLMSPN